MIKILFVCHGNICRSAMAEAIMKKMVNYSSDFYIDSAAVSYEEIGNPMYPPAVRKLREKGIEPGNHRARIIAKTDYEDFDHIIVMDDSNLRLLRRIISDDPDHKISKMMEFAGSSRSVADPWYTGDFERTYQDLVEGISGLLKALHMKSEK